MTDNIQRTPLISAGVFLGIHHVYEHTTNKLQFDLGFLAFGGVLLLVIGWLLIRAGSNDTIPRGEVR
jgi:uncharacterized membrane protein